MIIDQYDTFELPFGVIFNQEIQSKITPDAALQLLKSGNQRFVNNIHVNRNYAQAIKATANGQYPFAAVLGCIDSRVPAEMIFDLGIGDIFVARVAGNFVNEDILGSLEFACKIAGAKLIVVLGHSSCGAIKGACDQVKMGNLTTLLAKLQPAVESTETTGERNSNNTEFLQNVANRNVEMTVNHILQRSEILKEMADLGQVKIVGAMHEVANGRVTFFE